MAHQAVVDRGTPKNRVVCGESRTQRLADRRGTVAHMCTRKVKHAGTHFDEVTDTWFGYVPERGWLFFKRE